MKKQMVIKYDPDCMTDEQREQMDTALLAVLTDYGWEFYASGSTMGKDRVRDIALDRAEED